MTGMFTSYDIPVAFVANADGSQACYVRCDDCVAKLGVSRRGRAAWC